MTSAPPNLLNLLLEVFSMFLPNFNNIRLFDHLLILEPVACIDFFGYAFVFTRIEAPQGQRIFDSSLSISTVSSPLPSLTLSLVLSVSFMCFFLCANFANFSLCLTLPKHPPRSQIKLLNIYFCNPFSSPLACSTPRLTKLKQCKLMSTCDI